MKLEKIAIWRETGLFAEQADGSRGYLGFVRGAFAGDEISIDAGQLHIPAEAQYEYETLLCFLRSADASFLLKSAAAMTAVCSERLQCHIPYAFGRECYGFRVLSEHCAWYIAKFFNIPELMAMFKEVADVQTADMLNLPVPKANFHVEKEPSSEIQKEMVQSFADRAAKVHSHMVSSDEDNMLLITNDGRKAALDQRLLNPDLEVHAHLRL